MRRLLTTFWVIQNQRTVCNTAKLEWEMVASMVKQLEEHEMLTQLEQPMDWLSQGAAGNTLTTDIIKMKAEVKQQTEGDLC